MAEIPAEVVPDLEELRPLLYSRGLTVALPRNGLPEQPVPYRPVPGAVDVMAGRYGDPLLDDALHGDRCWCPGCRAGGAR